MRRRRKQCHSHDHGQHPTTIEIVNPGRGNGDPSDDSRFTVPSEQQRERKVWAELSLRLQTFELRYVYEYSSTCSITRMRNKRVWCGSKRRRVSACPPTCPRE